MAQNDSYGEMISLEQFIDARESAIGERLKLVQGGESPDFICKKPNGEIVGVEFTQILHDVHSFEIKRVLGDDYETDNFGLFWAAYHAVLKKEEKRKKPHWRLPDSTILVLDMMEVTRIHHWPEEPEEGFDETGFLEIWLADHASIEPFGAVSLFGLFPDKYWGPHGQDYLFKKPYG